MMAISSSLTLFGLLLAAQPALVAGRSECSGVRFTSFYAGDSPCDDGDTRCTFDKDNSYSLFPDHELHGGGGGVMILPNEWYRIHWASADKKYPVSLTWHFGASNETVMQLDSSSIKWAQNFTKDSNIQSFIWVPSRSINDFPTQYAKDWSPDIAMGFAGLGGSYNAIAEQHWEWNFLGISQPEKFAAESKGADDDDMPICFSDPFTLESDRVKLYLEAQYGNGRHIEEKWKKGVGIGVGLGLPVLMSVAFLIGRLFGKRSSSHNTPLTTKKERLETSSQ